MGKGDAGRGKIPRFRDWSIRKKFMMSCLPVMVILVAAILIISYQMLYNSNITKTEEIARDECEMIGIRLESMRENVDTCSNMLAQNINRVYSDVNVENVDQIAFIDIKNDIYTALDYALRCFPDVSSLVFIDKKANMSSAGTRGTLDYEELRADYLDQIPDKGMAVTMQFPMGDGSCFLADSPTLTFGKRIISMSNGKILGYILINISEERLSSVFPEQEEEVVARDYFLVDGEGIVNVSRQKERLLKKVDNEEIMAFLAKGAEGNGAQSGGAAGGIVTDSGKLTVNGEKALVLKEAIPGFGFTLVSSISIFDLTRDIRATAQVIFILGAAGIVLALYLTVILSKRISKPVQELTIAAEKLQNGDFSVRCPAVSEDEVGVLARTFNVMAYKVDCLLKEVETEQRRKREYELALIQAQVKPHFLYNTLDLIYVFCQSGMSKEGARMTKYLADFYRVSLSSGREIVTVQEEIKNVEGYLSIQRERYCDLMDFSVECEQEIRAYPIVKMTLQPLVENAIYHGLKEQQKPGTVRVRGYQEGNMLVFMVEDDGAGMTKERLEEVLSREEAKNHFGLRSVIERISLYYGKSGSVEVESRPGRGTRVTVRVPQKMEEKPC